MEGRPAEGPFPGTLTLYLSHVCVALSQRENVTSLHSICITISTWGTLAKDDAEEAMEQDVPDISGSHRGQLLLFLSYFFIRGRSPWCACIIFIVFILQANFPRLIFLYFSFYADSFLVTASWTDFCLHFKFFASQIFRIYSCIFFYARGSTIKLYMRAMKGKRNISLWEVIKKEKQKRKEFRVERMEY